MIPDPAEILRAQTRVYKGAEMLVRALTYFFHSFLAELLQSLRVARL